MESLCSFRGLCKGLTRFLYSRCRVSNFHIQTFFRAHVNAASTLDTVKTIDRPCTCFAVHSDRLGRTGAHAQTAGDTVFHPDFYVSPHAFRILGRFKRILGSLRLPEKVMEDSSANLNNRVFSILLLHSTAFAVLVSMNYHRSVQLMHGSIVRISSGTSASWHPFNISAIGGILLVVGVRRRKRSRNFVPFPLT